VRYKYLPYFLDSNVIIGYIFDNADNLGKYAKVVMGQNEEKHSGQTVKNECFGLHANGRCQTIKRKISGEFRKIIAALINGSMLNEILDQMEKKNCRTFYIIKDLADAYKGDPVSLVKVLRASLLDFEGGCLSRQDIVDAIVIFHNRNLPYMEIYGVLKKSIEDMDDIEVILDAHHVGLEISNLMLISGNYWDITAFRNLIRRVTSIAEVKSLTSFVGVDGDKS
jgi:hypothetical protein